MVTAHAGIDALSHAIEAYMAAREEPSPDLVLGRPQVGKNLLSDTLALTAAGHIVRNLERAVEDGSDLEARTGMLYGSLLAGIAFGNSGVSAAHALQFAVGALTHTSHGLGTGLLLPYVMEFNRPAREAELAELSRRDGRASAGRRACTSSACGSACPPRWPAIGVTQADLRPMAEASVGIKRLIDNNPRPLDADALEAILDRGLARRAGAPGARRRLEPHLRRSDPLWAVQPCVRSRTARSRCCVMRASAASTSPDSSTASTSWCSLPISDGEAQLGRSWATQRRISPRERAVEPLQARRADRADERVVKRAVGGDHLAPAGVVGQGLHAGDRLARRFQRRAALEHGAHDQALDRDPDREEVQDLLAREHRDVRAAVGLADEQALVAERLDGGADRRARDAELGRELQLGQPHAGLDLAVEDPRAQRDDDRFLGRDRPHGKSAHQAAKIVGRAVSAPSSCAGATAHRPSERASSRRHAAALT